MIRPEDIKVLRKIRSITTRAERFAELAHAGQVRRGTDQPYVEHCRRVARAAEVEIRRYLKPMRHKKAYESMVLRECVAAAFMHDVVEDSEFSLQLILEAGFSSFTVDIIRHLTKASGEQYEDYIDRIAGIRGFSAVIKICDIVDNLADEPSNAQVERYRRALITLCDP